MKGRADPNADVSRRGRARNAKKTERREERRVVGGAFDPDFVLILVPDFDPDLFADLFLDLVRGRISLDALRAIFFEIFRGFFLAH